MIIIILLSWLSGSQQVMALLHLRAASSCWENLAPRQSGATENETSPVSPESSTWVSLTNALSHFSQQTFQVLPLQTLHGHPPPPGLPPPSLFSITPSQRRSSIPSTVKRGALSGEKCQLSSPKLSTQTDPQLPWPSPCYLDIWSTLASLSPGNRSSFSPLPHPYFHSITEGCSFCLHDILPIHTLWFISMAISLAHTNLTVSLSCSNPLSVFLLFYSYSYSYRTFWKVLHTFTRPPPAPVCHKPRSVRFSNLTSFSVLSICILWVRE